MKLEKSGEKYDKKNMTPGICEIMQCFLNVSKFIKTVTAALKSLG